jgi:iron complex outermembrane receptor protein
VFGGWGQGFLPPATEELYANPDAPGGFNANLRPATSHGVEIGFRGSRARRFLYDVTLFRLVTHDDFERYRIRTRPLETFYRNAGHSRRYGLETLVRWTPIDPLSLILAYTYSDFIYTDYYSFSLGGEQTGNFLPNSPRHQAFAEGKYRFGTHWYVALSSEMQSRSYIDATNLTWIDGFALLGARVSYTWAAHHTRGELFVAGRNVTDVEYIAFTEPDPDGNSYQPGPTRELFTGVRLTF